MGSTRARRKRRFTRRRFPVSLTSVPSALPSSEIWDGGNFSESTKWRPILTRDEVRPATPATEISAARSQGSVLTWSALRRILCACSGSLKWRKNLDADRSTKRLLGARASAILTGLTHSIETDGRSRRIPRQTVALIAEILN